MDGLTVQTSDDISFVLLPHVCAHSTLLKTLAENAACSHGTGGWEDVPLPGITSAVMTRILQFIHMYDTSPFHLVKPLPPSQYEQYVPQEYREFLSQFTDDTARPLPLFYQTLQGANFLGVDALVALFCAYMAKFLSCKSAEEIKVALA